MDGVGMRQGSHTVSGVLPPTTGMIPYFSLVSLCFSLARSACPPFHLLSTLCERMKEEHGGYFYLAWLWMPLETKSEQNHKGRRSHKKRRWGVVICTTWENERRPGTKWNKFGKRGGHSGKRRTDGGGQKAQRWVDDTSVALTPAFFYVFSVIEYFGSLCFVLF